MSKRDAAPPKGGYVYQELQYDPMTDCNYIDVQAYHQHPDDLIYEVARRIAPLGDGIRRLEALRARLQILIDAEARRLTDRLTS